MNKHGGYFGGNGNVLDFSVNLNPIGMPSRLRDYLQNQWSVDSLCAYPEPTSLKARQRLATRTGHDQQEIILGNGATELIYLFARMVKAETVMILQPTFNEYERAFTRNGSRCIPFMGSEDQAFSQDLQRLKQAMQEEKPQVLVLCNPNNPTGGHIGVREIEDMLDAFDGLVMIDESFADFEMLQTADRLIDSGRVFLLRSLTKYFSIAGIRLGYGIAHRSLIARLMTEKEPWTVNALAGEIVGQLFEDTAFEGATAAWYEAEKAYLWERLSKLPYLKPLPSHANFFLCRTQIHSGQLFERLMAHGIHIRTCEDFMSLEDRYVRLAVRGREENERLIRGLEKIAEEWRAAGNYGMMQVPSTDLEKRAEE